MPKEQVYNLSTIPEENPTFGIQLTHVSWIKSHVWYPDVERNGVDHHQLVARPCHITHHPLWASQLKFVFPMSTYFPKSSENLENGLPDLTAGWSLKSSETSHLN